MKKNNRKKKVNIYRIIWVSGIFLILIIILLLVINYKINYEYLEKSYLYFYKCNDDVCVAKVNDGISRKDLYSKYNCGYEECPIFIKNIGEYYSILKNNDEMILYDFVENKVISSNYDDYKVLNDKYIIVIKDNMEGIIDLSNNLLVDTIYSQIGYYKDNILTGYNLQDVIVMKDNLYGIISINDGEVINDIKYNEENIDGLLKNINS